MRMQALIASVILPLVGALFPPRCLTCEAPVASDFGLCPVCWRDTPFVAGLVCTKCGLPLPGAAEGDERGAEDARAKAARVEEGRAGHRAMDAGGAGPWPESLEDARRTSDEPGDEPGGDPGGDPEGADLRGDGQGNIVPDSPGPENAAAAAGAGAGGAAGTSEDPPDVLCDDCLRTERPWRAGRTAMLYGGNARRAILAFKHGDRMDLAGPAGRWIAQVAVPLIRPGMVAVPVPLHWLRLARRRYNQSALLSAELARVTGIDHCPDALVRRRRTPSQEGHDRDARFANLDGALAVHPRRRDRIAGRPVLVVDDVMTSGATLTAAVLALRAGGAGDVFVVSLARVANTP